MSHKNLPGVVMFLCGGGGSNTQGKTVQAQISTRAWLSESTFALELTSRVADWSGRAGPDPLATPEINSRAEVGVKNDKNNQNNKNKQNCRTVPS